MERTNRWKQILVGATLVLMLMANFGPITVLAQDNNGISSYKTIIERAQERGITREMTLDDCMKMALDNNLDIKIVKYQPFLNQEQLNGVFGAYDFTLDATGQYSRYNRPNTNVVNSQYIGNQMTGDTTSVGATLSRFFSTGANLSINLSNDRSTSNLNETDPVYGARLQFDFTQPLWKDFKIDSTRRAIIQARHDLTISRIDFQNQVSEIVRMVEDEYWGLVNAIEQQNIQLQSRELALIQLRDNQKRVEIGTLAPIEITRTKSEVAQAEQGVIAAESSIIQAMNRLKNFIVDEPSDPLWNLVIIPIDKPEITETIPTEEEALRIASERRPEVKRMEITLDKNDTDISFYQNQMKPQVNFRARYSTQGTAGPNFEDGLNPITGDIILNPFKGGWGTVYSQLFKQDFPDYVFAVDFQYVFGNRSAKANLASTRIQKERNETTLTQTVQNIKVEVLSAIYTLRTDRQNLESAIVARQFREEQLDGETKRFQAGLATNFEVLQAQRDLAQSLAAELSARIDLKRAIVYLQRAMFINLDKFNLEFEE